MSKKTKETEEDLKKTKLAEKEEDLKKTKLAEKEEVKEEKINLDEEVKENIKNQDNEKLQEDYEKIKNSYQRLIADFENYKRRVQKESLDQKVKGKEEVLKQILDIVDNFDRALTFDIQTEEFKTGIEMVHNMLEQRLKMVGLKEVDTTGELDPNIHMAVAVENFEDLEDNHITSTLQKGYYVEDKLIRPAMVKVNKKN